MIIVNLMGGLGNQLFQYAAGRSLAVHHGTDLNYVFSDNYLLAKRSVRIDKYKIEARLLPAGAESDYFPKRNLARALHKMMGLNYEGRIFREKKYYDFDTAFFCLPEKTYLYGFWQSYSYFENIENIIHNEIAIKNPSSNYLKATECIKSLNKPVAIHVRRGDYLNDKSGFFSLSEAYYIAADRYLLENVGKYTPLIFSDDTEWVKNHMNCVKDPIFASDFHLEDFEELILMSHCSHHVVANSSFSWWGAWLNSNPDKYVLAPRLWHPLHTAHSKLIPPTWIILS